MKLDFGPAPQPKDADNAASECQRRLTPIINEVVRTAVAVGWSERDVLSVMGDVAWELYEQCRNNSGNR